MRLDDVELRDERLRRVAFFDEAASLTPYLAFETQQGELFFVSSDDKVLGRMLFARGGSRDAKILGKAVHLLGEAGFTVAGSTFVDVGANIGTTTVAAVRRYRFSRSVAVEPSATNARMLRINVVANGLDGIVRVIEAAVSDTEGEQRLFLSGRSSGEHALDPTTIRGKSSANAMVKTVTLEGLVARGEIDPAHVGMLWVDVAGTETSVLAGASTLIEAGVPIVVAVRAKESYAWPQSKAALVKLLASYTDFALLRRGPNELSRDVHSLLDGLRAGSDLLAIRR